MSSKSNHTKNQLPKIGITIGDINGIGPEVIIKALSDQRILNFFTPIIYGSSKVLAFYKKKLKLDDFSYHQAKTIDQINPKKVNVLNIWQDNVEVKPGTDNEDGGKYALMSIQQSSEDLKKGLIQAIVTAPINKNNIQADDFKFAGHTEYYQQLDQADDSVMLLCHEGLRVGVITGHIPLSKVSESITAEKLKSKIKTLIKSLKRDFGIAKPKIAIMGLNPHAGEEGLLGEEENNVIIPAINEFKQQGELVYGPYPSDGFFGMSQYKRFDAVLAMYHDQGLIPFKTIAFDAGVNFTAGLQLIRTSPDHGTAYNIAGKNLADETSMSQAIFMAYDIIKARTETSEKPSKPNPKAALPKGKNDYQESDEDILVEDLEKETQDHKLEDLDDVIENKSNKNKEEKPKQSSNHKGRSKKPFIPRRKSAVNKGDQKKGE
ncbi:4-hydroxythreonine-4-phosphate dehydrogenase PdxA [Aureibacter tunicatorum]|uniref:4-hydroxythreonine-4-phosphate dehydrogenase n=1 Tax=Aureibacter tunicatorum TaxID=866807 RepID=A0AAE3XSK9_9BACT|nr:4-hydroxythreonine-4-phosphate dehydrogenase PdxA [Aureibacter tunicatorum]MDR6241259.1 4-hydroxythreonine-4-phosphate dehydrogenase [Aureibacter tunicatorum]BDD03519.1 4-hydroxythreonine-4-phosphate dehydrogenase [Aureibacter tunicatorum]